MRAKELAALKLRMHRLNAGLSPDALAAKISKGQGPTISGQTIRRLERGDGNPYPATAKLIADYFGTTVTDLWPALLEDGEKSAA